MPFRTEGLIWSAVPSGSTTVWTPDPAWGFTGQLNGTALAGYLTYRTLTSKCSGNYGGAGAPFYETYTNYVYHDPFGVNHGFNYSQTVGCPAGSPASSTSGNGGTSDGSGYTLVGGSQVRTRNGSIITPGSSATGQNPSSLTDSNGNEINFHRHR